MRIALLGATGRTGQLVLAEAARRGHEVSALARHPQEVPLNDVVWVAGDIRDPQALTRVIEGTDVVISAVGARGRDADLHTVLARHTIAAMTTAGLSRYVGISVGGIDLADDEKGTRDRVIGALARALAGTATNDRVRELKAWQDSALDWTLIRVPRLVDGQTDDAAVVHPHRPPKGTTLHRSRLAALLVECATSESYACQAPFAADK